MEQKSTAEKLTPREHLSRYGFYNPTPSSFTMTDRATRCQGLNCNRLAEHYSFDYNLCIECSYKKDLIIVRNREKIPLQDSSSARWVNKDAYDDMKKKVYKLCSNRRRKDSMIKYCLNAVQMGNSCLVCEEEKFPETCEGVQCKNKATYHDDDYSICNECSKKKVLIVKQEKGTHSKWVDDESRWANDPSGWSGNGETNYCRKSKVVDGESQYCSNVLPPYVDQCYACRGINRYGDEGIIPRATNNPAQAEIVKHCISQQYKNGGKIFCRGEAAPESDYCNSCLKKRALGPFSLEDEPEEVERWITKEQYLAKRGRGVIVCSYSPPRGGNKDRFCGNRFIKVGEDHTDNRCQECEFKKGRSKGLLTRRNKGLTVEELLTSAQARCAYFDDGLFCGKMATNFVRDILVTDLRCNGCLSEVTNELGVDLITAYYKQQ